MGAREQCVRLWNHTNMAFPNTGCFDLTDTVDEFVSPRVEFPPESFSFGRAFGAPALGRHSVHLPPGSKCDVTARHPYHGSD